MQCTHRVQMTFVGFTHDGTPFVIRHFVFFSARPGQLETVFQGLQILESIPHARHIEVRRNEKLDTLSNEIDVVVYAEFDSDAALDAFKAHPLYQESIDRVRPNRELRFVADTRAN
jgi:hypothetical protein